MRAVGYRQARRYLEGRIDHDTMVAEALAATRQLAKRQRTWLRRMPGVEWFRPQDRDALKGRVAPFLEAPERDLVAPFQGA
jgi:tRNA dimethylallyltransferase